MLLRLLAGRKGRAALRKIEMPTLFEITTEAVVNTTRPFSQSAPVVASLADGKYVVVWQSGRLGTPVEDVRFQLYDASGSPVGEEHLATSAAGREGAPQVTPLEGGGFAVVWVGLDAASPGVFVQRFSEAGEPVGPTTEVQRYDFGDYRPAAIGGLADGGFVVVYLRQTSEGEVLGARRYDAAGAPQGGEIGVSDLPLYPSDATVVGLADGGFVVAWRGSAGDASDGLYLRRFDASGAPEGASVAIHLSAAAHGPTLVALADGGFAVAFDQLNDILVQRYDPDGAALGSPIVMGASPSGLNAPSLVALPDGGFLVSGYGTNDDGVIGQVLQWFGSDGSPTTGLVALATESRVLYQEAGLAAQPDGSVVVAYSGTVAGVATSDDILVRRVGPPGSAAAVTTERDLLVGTSGADTLVASSANLGAGDQVLGGAGTDRLELSGSGTFDFNGVLVRGVEQLVGTAANDVVLADGATVARFSVIDLGGGADALELLGVADLRTVTLTGVERISAESGASLQLFTNSLATLALVDGRQGGQLGVSYGGALSNAQLSGLFVAGVDFVQAGNRVSYLPDGTTFTRTSTFVTTVEGAARAPDLTALADGGYLATWTTFGVDAANSLGVYGQRFDAAGAASGAMFRVNTTTAGQQSEARGALLGDGGVVVVWTHEASGIGGDIYLQRYDASGAAIGGETAVNTVTTGYQGAPAVAGTADGGFVVTWYGLDADGSGILLRRFDASGAAVGAEMVVNTETSESQYRAKVAGLAGGGFVVVWISNTGDTQTMRGQVFDPAGAKVGAEMTLSQDSANYGDVVALADGGFAVAWSAIQFGVYDTFVRIYGADGTARTDPLLANTTTNGSQQDPHLAAVPDGGFAVGWSGPGQQAGVSATAFWVQRFQADGTRVAGETYLSNAGVSDADLVALGSGDLRAVVANNSTTLVQDGLAVSDTNWNPVVATGPSAVAFTEGANTPSAPVAIAADLTITDLDSPSLASATVAITGGFQAGQDVLTLAAEVATVGNISASYNAATGQLTLTSAGATATLAQWQAALRAVTYTNGSETPNTSARTISITASDGTGVSTAVTRTVNITAQNDRPEVAGLSGAIPFTEGGAPVALAGGATVADPDGSTLARVTVTISGGFQAGADTLSVALDGATTGNIAASYDAARGVLTLTSPGATATLSQWQTALRAVTYVNGSDAPAPGARTVTFVANDGFGDSNGASQTVTVSAVNDPPAFAGSGGTAAFVEGVNAASTAVAVAAAVTVADADHSALASATVRIVEGLVAGEDRLAFAGGAATGNITGAYDADTGTLSLTSAGATATLAQWQAALRAVTYGNGSEEPVAGDRTIAITVSDGVTASSAATFTVSVTARNDAPAGASATLSLAHGAARALAAADFGFMDPDGDALAAVRIGALPAAGTLTLDGNPVSAGQSVSAADIAAGRLVFTPAPGGSGAAYASLSFQVQDAGGVAAGGADLDPVARTLTFSVGAPPPPPPPETEAAAPAPAATSGSDSVQLDPFNRTFAAGAGDDQVVGSLAADTIGGEQGQDSLAGGAGDDSLDGGDDADRLDGGAGDDSLAGGAGDDTVSGGAGADLVEGGDGAGYLRGGEGDDSVTGGADFDDAHGNQGNDVVRGGGGDDWVVGGKDDDSLFGDDGADLVYGNIGADTLEGGEGADIVRGGQDDDLVRGGAGDDFLSGDRGRDTLAGGGGADTFHIWSGAGEDRVLDFSAADGDRVAVLLGETFTVEQVGEDVVVAFEGGARLTLEGVQLQTLQPGWIIEI